MLKNRGYDSAGIATISPSSQMVCANNVRYCMSWECVAIFVLWNQIFISFTDLYCNYIPSLFCSKNIAKYASDGDNADGIDLVAKHSSASIGHHVGIAHTRWATHGGKTDENAHPHTDASGKIALVHNGTINNANPLRKELIELGYKFTSQTDTEVIAKLIGHIYATEKVSVKAATEKALSRCDGTWGLCIMCTDTPDELVVACNGSPLVIGVGADRTFIASETSAFNRYTKNFISMKDGEIGVLHADGRTLDLSRTQKAPDQKVEVSPAPYPHWTLKE